MIRFELFLTFFVLYCYAICYAGACNTKLEIGAQRNLVVALKNKKLRAEVSATPICKSSARSTATIIYQEFLWFFQWREIIYYWKKRNWNIDYLSCLVSCEIISASCEPWTILFCVCFNNSNPVARRGEGRTCIGWIQRGRDRWISRWIDI